MHLDEDKFRRSQGDTFLFDLFSNKLHICAENTVLYLLFYPCEILIANIFFFDSKSNKILSLPF